MKQNNDRRREGSFGGFQYRWNYDEYQKSLQRKRRKNATRGMQAFCLTSVFVILLCFASLVVVMAAALMREQTIAEDASPSRTAALPRGDWSIPSDSEQAESDEPLPPQNELNAINDTAAAKQGAEDTKQQEEILLPNDASSDSTEIAKDQFSPILNSSAISVEEITALCADSTVTVQKKDGTEQNEHPNNGFFLSEDGYIAVNYHTIAAESSAEETDKNSVSYEAVLPDGSVYNAQLISFSASADADLALLKIDVENALPVNIPESLWSADGEEKTSMFVLYTWMDTHRAVIASENSGASDKENDNHINENNAAQNNQIGSAPSDPTLTEYKKTEGTGPDSDILEIEADQNERTPLVLGIRCEAVTENEAVLYRVPRGILVRRVEPDSPAEQNGIKGGDILLSVDDTVFDSLESFDLWESNLHVSDKAVLRIFRDGVELETEISFSGNTNTDNSHTEEIYTEVEIASLLPETETDEFSVSYEIEQEQTELVITESAA
ncbi:MAG: PDZ domain-containing protein [Clostridia bacterium]|nr:PDZ domain-containing protein [Clostridia bacterium]